jgi:hypothetical protein
MNDLYRISKPRQCNLTDLNKAADIHVTAKLYLPQIWAVMRQYIWLMYPDNSTREWCDRYIEGLDDYTDDACP